ncbi:hypothetical protein [Cellulomonas sp. PhB143]|uniref:hypothetical protein n=1 Tax=Cellulomonas sp. PhB143 TaxID=2485186 RepID=UPI000F48DF03|nr:hypothetical protein [Cellulomonas sp. PhB143]ROS75299.1 hypothetical protein EDF32_1707 [Cellulomonas sp. PhB143]
MTSSTARGAAAPTLGPAFWVAAAVTLVSAFVSLGYSVAGVIADGASDEYALYAASRSVALAAAAIAVLTARSTRVLLVVGGAMTIVQAFDGLIGLTIDDTVKTVGPFAAAVVTAVALGFAAREARRPGARR